MILRMKMCVMMMTMIQLVMVQVAKTMLERALKLVKRMMDIIKQILMPIQLRAVTVDDPVWGSYGCWWMHGQGTHEPTSVRETHRAHQGTCCSRTLWTTARRVRAERGVSTAPKGSRKTYDGVDLERWLQAGGRARKVSVRENTARATLRRPDG